MAQSRGRKDESGLSSRGKQAAGLLASLVLVGAGLFSVLNGREYDRTEFLMSTPVSVKAYGIRGATALGPVFASLQDIDRRMGASDITSEVAKINANAGIQPVKVGADTFQVIRKAIEYAAISGGKFDITLGPVIDLWGIGTSHAAVPAASDLAAKLALVDYRKVQLDEQSLTVYLPVKGMAIDLGGIGKGYAADVADEIFVRYGVKHALMNLGESSIYVQGGRPDGQDWRIGIQDPDNLEAGYMGILQARDEALSTSGAYERYFVQGGVRYHHIIDPATGYPSDSDILSVTVVSPGATDGDALSTSVFILGRERGMAMIEQLGLNCVVIAKDHSVWLTPGLKGRFEITSSSYHLAP